MTCKDGIHSGLCYKEKDYDNFPDRCGSFIFDKVLEERPQGDLISRSEAEKLGATCLAKRNENGQLEAIISLDNAPTVKPRIEYGTDGQPYILYITNGIEERPQDEWIDYDNTFYKCPECGYLLEKCCPQCQNKVILPKGGAE